MSPEPRRSVGPLSVMASMQQIHGAEVDPSVELSPEVPATAAPDDPAHDGTGAETEGQVRRYRVGPEIARGGMGAILQVRDNDLRRTLAMKVLLGADGGVGGPVARAQLERFLEEAQVTAQLDHPGVVPVHELGIGPDGGFFFTMSLVHGATLGEVFALARCGRDGWGLTRAIQTLLRVCETMAFAHAKGVVHRDLKPGNVMVGDYGQVYVMDWGLAKVQGQGHARDIRLADVDDLERVSTRRSDQPGAPLLTMDGAVLGTPCYMPPEQARGQVDEVDAQSDVYAIGAMLYELLAGHPPYVEDGETSPLSVLRRIHDDAPRRLTEVTTPSAPAELIAIAEKAMSRSKTDRYASAADLSDDLQRYLSGHVVHAHRTGPLIELQKWVRRNRVVAGTIAAALLIIAAGTAAFVLTLDAAKTDAEDARDVARDQEAAAKDARARAERLMSFMLFDLRDKLEAIGRVELLATVAEQAHEYYESLPRDEDDEDRLRNRGVALNNLGDVQLTLGRVEPALAAHREALEISRRLVVEDPMNPGLLEDLAIAHDYVAGVLGASGDLPGAEREHRAALIVRERRAAAHPDPEGPQQDIAYSHGLVADIVASQGRLEEASEGYDRALAIHRRVVEADPDNEAKLEQFSTALQDVGGVATARGRWSRALELFREAHAIAERLAAKRPEDLGRKQSLALALGNLGHGLQGSGDLDDAAAALSKAVAISEKLSAADPANADWKRNLSLAYRQLGSLEVERSNAQRATEHFRTAIANHRALVQRAPQYASEVAWLESCLRDAEFFAGTRTPVNPKEHARFGHALVGLDRWSAAAEQFDLAFREVSDFTGFQRPDVYAAICAAARAVEAGDERWRAKALEWIAEDLRLLRATLDQDRAKLDEASDEGERERLRTDIAELSRKVEAVRTTDPALAPLRGTREFEALFE